ncbi:MAG: sulfotransferase [Aquisalimonadaceae bacterium]
MKRINTALLQSLPGLAMDRVLMQPRLHRMLLPFGRELKPRRWVFVLGCYNSGTTLLASVLGQHPEIGGLRTEGVYLTDSLPYPEAYGWPRMWWQCLERVRLPIEGQEERARRIRRQWSIWYPRGIDNLLEKSVANAARMPFLNAYFQPAYFIYIIRNGYAAAAGIREKANLKRWGNPYADAGYPMQLCARQWLTTDELVQADSRKVRHFLPVYYEDLTARPAETLASVTTFLGLQPMPVQVVGRDWSVHGIKAPIRDMNAVNIARLSETDIDAVEAVAGKQLRRHGYQRPDASPVLAL